ncbi:type VII secretion protein EccCa [Mycobacterium branderi]|uniref:Type VII secretion protein EccC n=1 Tax=Mycobacterium branderi TaxID=43348 RepID=A0A7I7WDX1_9MYCO|nr:type VII secretion protein EccCa [Mycobacterium branderi]MCV7235254.1 type VII secretion protein EccCa [Mycobacterium branderi]ORA29855.1 type VII secretion protein EccC [Mycobacterium branderi]BBZ15025.1 type VII secretion protein EccC [Mycobacterium branderi]
MTTQPFVRPGELERPPATGGGKIAVEPPLVAPIPPPRSVWGIVLPIALVVGVVGFIISMYVTGMRTFASGFGIFGFMMLIGMGGMLFRGRGAAQKMSWGELTLYRRKYFARLDEVRDEVDVQRRAQWQHRAHFHWEPQQLVGAVGSARMWERIPGSDEFAVVRVGVGKVALAMQIDKPKIAESADLEPATAHALRKFLIEQEYIDNTAKAIWLQRFPGLSVVGDMSQVRALARAMICQLAAFHSPADVQIIVVSAAPTQWEWTKWLPHMQHRSQRDGCGERRLLFSSPAKLESFLDEAETPRPQWSPPASGLHAADTSTVLPLRVIVDDGCGTPEDWAGLTGSAGYGGTCFIRLAAAMPVPPPDSFGGRHWVGFDPSTTYRLVDGVLRKRLPADDPTLFAAGPTKSDELEEVFYATADQMSVVAVERFARALARYRATGATAAVSSEDEQKRTLLDVVGVRDPRELDVDRLWAPRRIQGREWMRFPIGLDDNGQVVELDLKEGSQQGMGMHSLFIGTTGAGKSEGIITEVTSLALTHSPEVVNVVFSDFKLKSAAGVLERFPHVVASVSNLADERHLVGRMYEALDGELDRRGQLCAALDGVPDLNAYNQRRLTDPSLPPVPALFIICDEYQEMLGDKDWGPQFQKLFWRIVRLGRAYHMFLQLVGQTVDTQKLREIRKLLGFTIAARTGREEDSREAIGTAVAAHLPEKGAEGTAYLRVAQRQPREYRFFFSSAPYVPPSEVEETVGPVRAGTWFNPRPFTVVEATDPDGRLAAPQRPEPARAPAARIDNLMRHAAGTDDAPKVVDAVIESLQATGVGPPRQLWLPPLGVPPPADDLVGRLRGKPWDVDYGDNPGLVFPIALEDRPREHRQDVFCLDLLSDNAMIVAAPKRGATNAVMTMVATGALMYRPERVQFYCVAASGPQLAAVGDLPHVATVVPVFDTEGVNRLLATVQGIIDERERTFASRGLDMMTVRQAKFGPHPSDIGVAGGDVVVVIDGWANFAEAMPKHVDTVMSLMRARNYGVRVVVTHTSHLSGMRTGMRAETAQKLELRLTDPRESEVERVDGVNRAREVPDTPGRGLSPTGHHLMIGVPELANQPSGRVEVRGLGAVVRAVAGVEKVSEVLRLPESVPMAEVAALVDPRVPRERVPFGLSETTLGPAFVDFAEHPHVVAVGRAQSGRTNFLRVMMRSIMSRYSSEEATIVLFDPRRKLVGVVPEEWLSRYSYAAGDMRKVVDSLCQLLEERQPPPGTSQQEMLTRRFWTGRRIFLVIDDITSWQTADSPLVRLAPYVEQADQLGLHIVAAADIRNWSFQSSGPSVLGRTVGSLPPVLILDGRRDNGPIISGVYAEPQRPGKAIYVTPTSTEGVLIGWSPPPNVGAPSAPR